MTTCTGVYTQDLILEILFGIEFKKLTVGFVKGDS